MRKHATPAQRRTAEADDILWALRDVSFDVHEGEVVGIIGRNGAGKSTLLKILSRITEPTHGRAVIRGRVSSLLEVGTGFHPELTGRENIYMNGTILGMRKKEIDKKFDEIVDFSGVEKFLDTPIKRYSSGMQVRLAFAVAAHLEPEILIIDEVLAVGDAEFQKKCLGKMQDVAKGGRTVLFVSHNMAIIRGLCGHCILVRNGTIAKQAPTEDALADYQTSNVTGHRNGQKMENSFVVHNSDEFVRSVEVFSASGKNTTRMGGDLTIRIQYSLSDTPSRLAIGIAIEDAFGTRMFNSTPSREDPALLLRAEAHGFIECHFDQLPLTPGQYYITLVAANRGSEILRKPCVAYFEVTPFDLFHTGQIPTARDGYFFVRSNWRYVTEL